MSGVHHFITLTPELARALIAEMQAVLDGEPVAVSPLITSPGCEFRIGEAGFSYRFADGSVTTRGG